MEAIMGMYKYVREIWKDPQKELGDIWKQRLLAWKDEPVTVRIEKPTRIDRARSLGYKAKQGYLVVRQRLLKQRRMRPQMRHPRRSKHMRRKKVLHMTYQWIAEQRVERAYPNCTVLSSYFVGESGTSIWYEVILVDRSHPVIKADPRINWIVEKKGRALRGVTTAGRKTTLGK